MKQILFKRFLFFSLCLISFQNIFTSQADQVVKVLKLAKAAFKANSSGGNNPNAGLSLHGGLRKLFVWCMQEDGTKALDIGFPSLKNALAKHTKNKNILLHMRLIGAELNSENNQFDFTMTARNADSLDIIPSLSYQESYVVPATTFVDQGYVSAYLLQPTSVTQLYNGANQYKSDNLDTIDLEDFYVGIYNGAIFVIPTNIETLKAFYIIPAFKSFPTLNNTLISANPTPVSIPKNVSFFNINFVQGVQYGYAFLSDPWSKVTTKFNSVTANGISQHILGWTSSQYNIPNGMQMVLLAFDNNGAFISDFTQNSNPAAMALCIYDNSGNLLFEPTLFSSGSYSGNTSGKNPTISSNSWELGFTGSQGVNITYPFILQFE